MGEIVQKNKYLEGCSSEKAMAPHSSTFAWKIPRTEEPGRLQSMRSLESDTTERLHFHFSLWCIGEGNGNPLQCSCLEKSRDRGAWWAAIYGVAQSRTWLKRLSSSKRSRYPCSLCDALELLILSGNACYLQAPVMPEKAPQITNYCTLDAGSSCSRKPEMLDTHKSWA